MGFFGDLWDGVKTAASNIWNGITNLFSSNERTATTVGSSESYYRDTASADETRRVNYSLDEFKNRVVEQSADIENKLYDDCERMLDDLVDKLESMGGRKIGSNTLEINSRQLESDNKKLLKSIKGSIKKTVMPSVSIDNDECLSILELSAGSYKKQKMKKFIDNQVIDALRDLHYNIEDGIKNAVENVENMLENKSSQLENLSNSSVDLLNNFKNTSDADEREKNISNMAEKLCLYKYSLKMLKQLKAS